MGYQVKFCIYSLDDTKVLWLRSTTTRLHTAESLLESGLVMTFSSGIEAHKAAVDLDPNYDFGTGVTTLDEVKRYLILRALQ